MRILTIGNAFQMPMLLYDIFLYGGALLTFISLGMLLFGAIQKKPRRVWGFLCLIGVLMLVLVALSMIYGLGELVA